MWKIRMRNMRTRIVNAWIYTKDFFHESWDVLLILGALVALLCGGIGYGVYDMHYREKWATEARLAKNATEAEVQKQDFLAEAFQFANGDKSFDELNPRVKEMIEVAEAENRHWKDRDLPKVKVYPELYDVVPGITPPGLKFDNEPTPTVEEFQKRVAAFYEKHKSIYGKQGRSEQLSREEYLRLDRRELHWLTTMGNRLNDRVTKEVDDATKAVPMVKDAVAAIRFSHSYGSGQTCWSANVEGYNPNDNHSRFADELTRVLVASDYDLFVPDGTYGNGIWLPTEKPDPAIETVKRVLAENGVELPQPKNHSWAAVYNPREMRHESYDACSMTPPVLLDLTGRIVAIQIGKEALRVTFYDEKGKPGQLTQAVLQLAKLLGVSPKKEIQAENAQWMRVHEKPTWELKLGA